MDNLSTLRPASVKRLDRGYAYWDKIRAGRPMPSRTDFDPLDIPDLLPYILLIEVLRDPLDFKFRLVGTGIDQIVSTKYRGMRYSTSPHMKPGTNLWDQHLRVIEERKPLLAGVEYVGPQKSVEQLAHWLLPFSSDGENVDTILAVAAIELKPGAALS